MSDCAVADPKDANCGWDLVSLGEPMVEFSSLPGQPGQYLQGFGGDTMNVAIAAARQGARVAYITRIGTDEFGQQLQSLWCREGIDQRGIHLDAESPTAIYFISHGIEGHTFTYRRGGSAASKLAHRDIPLEVLERSTFFHTSGITQAISTSACDAAFEAMEYARRNGVKVVYDSNLRLRLWPLRRAKAIIETSIPLADFFLPSLDDARTLTGYSEPEAILDWALALGARHVALKLGAGGVLASDGRKSYRIPAVPISLVDATGAGDCFAGTLIAEMASGRPFERALAYANCAAGLVCEGVGAIAPLPYRENVETAMLVRTPRG